MDKTNKLLIVIVFVLGVLFLLGLYLYISQGKPKSELKKVEEAPTIGITEGPKQGELDYQEPQTKIEIGTQGVTKGTFEKVEAGNIFLREGDTLIQFPLTSDEVAVSCTTQDLSSATELDFNLVTKVKVATPTGVADLIPAQEQVVVFAQVVEGVNTVHTVAMDASKCSE